MALVDDDHIEILGWDGLVVDDRQRLFRERRFHLEERAFLLLGVELGLTFEHRVESLDGGDDHLARRPDGVRFEPLNVVQLIELSIVVRRAVVGELLVCLFTEIGSVHQEEHSPSASILDEAINRGDRQERLARPSGHLDQRSGPVLLERLVQVRNGFNLVLPQVWNVHRRQRLNARAQGRGFRVVRRSEQAALRVQALHPCVQRVHLQPLGQRLRSVEMEDAAASGVRVEAVRELGDRTGG